VEESLRTALAGLGPKPTYEHHARFSLNVKYKARKFIVHAVNMTGQYSEKAHEEYGPSLSGFMLNIQVQSAGLENQAVVP
jgi:hypothetical protein